MTNDFVRHLDGYFGVTPRLLPYLGELLADLSELGSDPDLVVSWLDSRGVDSTSRVLDLGCGKGAVSIRVARAFGCSVDGVDAYAPFIAEAKSRAAELGVAALCDFQVGDINDRISVAKNYDAVLFLAVGGILGSPADCIGSLRRSVRRGGVMILDDAYRLTAVVDFPGYEHLLGRDETLTQLASHGDLIVAENLVAPEVIKAQNLRYQAWIECRAAALAAREPHLAADIAAYVEKERQECILLERDVQCTMWMIERT